MLTLTNLPRQPRATVTPDTAPGTSLGTTMPPALGDTGGIVPAAGAGGTVGRVGEPGGGNVGQPVTASRVGRSPSA